MSKQSIPQVGKSIRYNRHTKDYDCSYNGDYICSAKTYFDAEALLNDHVYECLAHGLVPTELELAADRACYEEAMSLPSGAA